MILKTLKVLIINLIAMSVITACGNHKEPIRSIEVAAKGIHGAALSNDGKRVVIGSIYHGGSLWRTSDGERLFNWNHTVTPTTITAIDFSPDGNWVLTSDPHTLVLWNVRTGEPTRFWSAPGEILSIALSNDGNYALIGLSNHTAILFNVIRGGIERVLPHSNRVRSVDLSDSGYFALTGSEDFTATFWDLKSGKPLQQITHDDDVQLVVLSPDGKKAMSASKYDKALLWSTESGKVLGEIPLASEKLHRGVRFISARFNQNGKKLLTGRPDQTVQLWDTRAVKELYRWKIPKRDAWKPTGAAVIAVSFSGYADRYYAVASNGFMHTLAE